MIAWILFFSVSAQAAIFGSDSRQQANFHAFAPSVALQVPLNFVSTTAAGRLNFDFASLNDPNHYNVCRNEPFAAEKVSPVACTGFLVAPDLLVTAGHCAVNWTKVKNTVTPHCESFAWLFDYRVGEKGEQPAISDLPADRFVRCKQVAYANFEIFEKDGRITFGEDIALIQLERPLLGRPLVPLASGAPALGEKLSILGHPLGLPLKSAQGEVRAYAKDFFRTDLDVEGGNSGSAVFNAQGEVAGVLVRSFPDFDFVEDKTTSCVRWNRCVEGGKCLSEEDPFYTRGAEVQRIQALLPYLPR